MGSAIQSPPRGPTETKSSGSTSVSVDVNRLLVGHRLAEPIHDARGVLLLAPGSTITSRFKELLLKRGEQTVKASPVDVAVFDEAAAKSESAGAGSDVAISPQTTKLIEKFDLQIQHGSLLVKNSGPPLAERVKSRGTSRYEAETVAAHRSGQSQHASANAELMGRVRDGQRVESHPLMQTAAETLAMLLDDADCAIATALNDLDGRNLSDHALRTSILSMAVGIEMGLDEDNTRLLGLCGLVHDWGMCRVRPELLNAARTLHPVDFLEIKKHPIWTLEMLQNVSGLPQLAAMVCYQSHERPDGQGYPRGRKTPQTHPFARILRVVDTFSALLCERPFRHALMPAAAMECLVSLVGEDLLEGDAVRRLTCVLSMFPPGSAIQLSDGRLGRVLRRNGNHTAAPIIEVLPREAWDGSAAEVVTEVLNPRSLGVSIQRAIPRCDRVEGELSGEDIDRSRR
jgi:HD-GYP domain-containing protein (c-di-GMP phosphodiesterase class II)